MTPHTPDPLDPTRFAVLLGVVGMIVFAAAWIVQALG